MRGKTFTAVFVFSAALLSLHSSGSRETGGHSRSARMLQDGLPAVFTRSGNLAEKGEWEQAAQELAAGYSVNFDSFLQEAEPGLASQTRTAIQSVQDAVRGLDNAGIRLHRAADAAEKILERISLPSGSLPPENEQNAVFPAVFREIGQIAGRRKKIEEAGRFFAAAQNRNGGKDLPDAVSDFLQSAYLLTTGGPEQKNSGGILGLIDGCAAEILYPAEETGYRFLEGLWAKTIKQTEEGQVPARTDFPLEKIVIATDYLSGLNSLAALFAGSPEKTQRNAENNVRFLSAAASASAVQNLIEQNEIRTALTEESRNYEREVAQNGYTRFAANSGKFRNIISALDGVWTEAEDFPANFPYQAGDSVYADCVLRGFRNLAVAAEEDLMGIYQTAASIHAISARTLYSNLNNQFLYAKNLLDGISFYYVETGTDQDNGGNGEPPSLLRKYPDESLSQLHRLAERAGEGIQTLRQRIQTVSSAPQAVFESAEYRAAAGELQTFAASIEALRQQIFRASAEADQRIEQAEEAAKLADAFYQTAERHFHAGRTASAREHLVRAQEAALQSLALRESEEFRKETDARFTSLGGEIVRLENTAVIQEVRKEITSGKDCYRENGFSRAKNHFLTAENLWNTTNAGVNPEIENWLEITNSALRLHTDRTLSVSDPLLREAGQMLNTAHLLYRQGARQIESGKREEGIHLLAEAEEALRQVQLLYPHNGNAARLSLRIRQTENPQAFAAFLLRRLAEIQSSYKNNAQAAYTELLDLESVCPENKMLRRQIAEVASYLGLNPITRGTEAVRRSDELAQEARRIYAASQPGAADEAVRLLNEALILNPENTRAAALKDSILGSTGGSRTVILNSENEEKYQQALYEWQSGNIIYASAIIRHLMQSPDAANAAKVQELQKRIDALL